MASARVQAEEGAARSALEEESGGEDEEELPVREVLTVRSIVVGLLIGTITTMENIYFALKYGFTTSNNISAAILGFGALKPWGKFTAQENVVLMTVAVSATAMVWGGSMPFAVLAMTKELRDDVDFGDEDTDTWEPSIGKLVVYSAALCFIGFCLAIPLRNKFVVREPLPFPYALAAAKTIEALHADDRAGPASQTNPPRRYDEPLFLLKTMVPATAWAMFVWCVDGLERVPLFGLRAKEKYQWQLNLSIGPFGHGFIVPARYILSELLGASVASGLLLPLAVAHRGHWYDRDASGFEGQDAYYLLPAIFAIAADSVYQLLKIFVVYVLGPLLRHRSSSLLGRNNPRAPLLAAPLLDSSSASDESSNDASSSVLLYDNNVEEDDAEEGATRRRRLGFQNKALAASRKKKKKTQKNGSDESLSAELRQPWFLGWVLSSIIAMLAFRLLFKVRYDMAAVALLSSPLWSVGITLACGTTGSNVASSAGKVMIMLFAAWYGGPGHVVQTLALGALAIAIIDQALDLVRDFKTAHLLNVSPRAMFLAQCVGAGFSIFTSSILYYVYTNAVSLPSANLPAVIAQSYRGLAFTFANGFGTLPDNALAMSLACGGLAVSFNLLHDVLLPSRLAPYCPSGVAFGVGIILLPGQILIEVVGLAVHCLWGKLAPESRARRDQQLGAAFLAGDGLAGVLQSVLEVANVQPPRTCSWRGWYH